MKVPLLDLKSQYAAIRNEVEAAVAEVFESQGFVLGPRVEACEDAVARYVGARHGVGVSSGTDALLVALMAEGIGPGDEVITSPYTFFATGGSIVRAGATPVFADIDPDTFNISPARAEARLSRRTRALMPVHLYGQMADMAPLADLAKARSLVVIEDACQSIGAAHGGRRAGAVGEYGCLSFYPSKNLSGAGDGGMVLTNDPERAARLRCLRNHGMEPKYYHKIVGGNFRLDALQAAVVLAKVPYLDRWTEGRRRNASLYSRLFEEFGLTSMGDPVSGRPLVSLPKVVTDRHVFNQYVIRTARRDELRAFMAEQGIGTEIYYPRPLHLQECFAGLGYRAGDFPESERAAAETLALPIYPELSEGQVRYVVECILGFFS